ncbi:MAG: acyltransferase [Cohaesibacteraceae bacterium]
MIKPTVVVSDTARVSPEARILGDGRVTIGDHVVVERGAELHATGGGLIEVGSRSKIKGSCYLKCYGGRITIGHRSTIGEFSLIAGHGGVDIGDYCMLAPYVMLNAASHILDGNEPYRFQGEKTEGIKLHNNVWLGARTTVLDGVTIGESVVVGAHSLVNRDLAKKSTVVGSPARPIQNGGRK